MSGDLFPGVCDPRLFMENPCGVHSIGEESTAGTLLEKEAGTYG